MPQGEIYALQNELAYLIAGQIFPELVRVDAEKDNKKPPEVLDVWAQYHKARTRQAIYQKENQVDTIQWVEKALPEIKLAIKFSPSAPDPGNFPFCYSACSSSGNA